MAWNERRYECDNWKFHGLKNERRYECDNWFYVKKKLNNQLP